MVEWGPLQGTDTSPSSQGYLTLLYVGEVEQLWLNGDHSKDSEASPSSPAHLQKPRQRVHESSDIWQCSGSESGSG